jgi:hypothetical protein
VNDVPVSEALAIWAWRAIGPEGRLGQVLDSLSAPIGVEEVRWKVQDLRPVQEKFPACVWGSEV